MRNRYLLILLVTTFTQFGSQKLEATEKSWDYNYCIPIERVDFNPYRRFQDGKELAYLMLFRSYISTDPSETGVLDGFEFSPDGKTFTGRLAKDLRWDDGSAVLPAEAGEVLVKTLPFRTIGDRIKINFNLGGPTGVKTIDSKTFQIHFDTQIENVTGVWREALSTNSRHNRFWLYKKEKNGKEKVLAKHKHLDISGQLGLEIGKYKVALLNKDQCKQTDFTIFFDAIESSIANYSTNRSSSPSAISVLTNSQRLSLADRTAMISFVREAFHDLPKEQGFSNADSFFMPGEAGFSDKKYWQKNKKLSNNRKYKIAYGNPIFLGILEKAAKKKNLKISFIATPFKDEDVDAGVLASGMQNGRHVILQDFLEWPYVRGFLKKAPVTLKDLSEIAKRSASTIPPDNKILNTFEKNSSIEQAFAPAARKYPMAYSKKNLPICLKWTPVGELHFQQSPFCSE